MRISDWSSDVCSSDLVVGGHRVVRVELAAAAVFEMLEPPGYSVPACGSLNGCPRGDVAEHADGFIERRAVLTVEHGMDERGCPLWRNCGLRCGGCYQIGRASRREIVCQYVSISLVAVSYKKKYK